MTAEQEAKAEALGWELDRSPSTEMRDGNWYRHGGTFGVKGEEAVAHLIERAEFEREYWDIWRCFYDGTCPTGAMRDEDLADLRSRFPGHLDPQS